MRFIGKNKPGVFALTLAVSFLVLGPAGAVRADFYWQAETVTTIQVGGKPSTLGTVREQYYLKQNVTRVDDVNTGVARFYNFQSRAVVIVNFQAKIFAVLPIQELSNQINQDREATRKDLPNREQMLSTMNPKARPLMAAQIEAQKRKYELWSRTYTVAPTNDRAQVNGHPCQKYLGLSGEETFQEIWVAEDIPVDDAYRNFFVRGMSTLDRQEYGHLAKVNGLPLKVVSHYGPVTVTVNYNGVSTSPVPAEAFILPKDLRPSPNVVRAP